MHIAILGSGSVAKRFATVFSTKGHPVVIISRNIGTASAKLHEILSDTVTVGDSKAIRQADVVFLALGGHPSTLADAEKIIHGYGVTNDLIQNKIIIDATNPFSATETGQYAAFFKLSSLGETYQCLLPGSRFYKAFNTIGVLHLGNATFQGIKATMMYAGDANDAEAVATVESLIRDTDFEPQWVGPMRFARHLESIAELWVNMAYITKATKEVSNNFAISVLTKTP
jgi:predicted dinucleotide-binding enzyme